MKRVTAVWIVVLAIGGCGSENIASDRPVVLDTSPTYVAYPDGYDRPASREEIFARNEADARLSYALRSEVAMAPSWEEAHVAARAVLAADTELPRFYVEQLVASTMIPVLLPGEGGMSSPISPERADALGMYLEMAVAHGSPDAEGVARALAHLEGHWPESTISRVARDSYAAAEAYLEAVSGCGGCRAAESARRLSAEVGSPKGPFVRSALEGSEALRSTYLTE